jgi:hypothetical protein
VNIYEGIGLRIYMSLSHHCGWVSSPLNSSRRPPLFFFFLL